MLFVGNITEKKARAAGFQNTISAEGNVSNLKEQFFKIMKLKINHYFMSVEKQFQWIWTSSFE